MNGIEHIGGASGVGSNGSATTLPIYQVDAFARAPFGGNPAAVVPLDAWLPDDILQRIAQENNLSETAFVVPRHDDFHLRWFTPVFEVDLCGHATLAAGYVLLEHLYPARSRVDFHTRSGPLPVERADDLLAMDLPAHQPSRIEVTDEVIHALGARPDEVHAAPHLLTVFSDQTQIEKLAPDFVAMSRLERYGLIATAPGRDADFVSRFFAPSAGIPEDPATGSAHCTLVPYWSGRLNKRTLHALQLSTRIGEFFCEDRDERVRLSGRVREYLRGEIYI